MDRQAIFLLAFGLLIAAALAVSASGWVLFLRDRTLAKGFAHSSGSDEHHEVHEES